MALLLHRTVLLLASECLRKADASTPKPFGLRQQWVKGLHEIRAILTNWLRSLRLASFMLIIEGDVIFRSKQGISQRMSSRNIRHYDGVLFFRLCRRDDVHRLDPIRNVL